MTFRPKVLTCMGGITLAIGEYSTPFCEAEPGEERDVRHGFAIYTYGNLNSQHHYEGLNSNRLLLKTIREGIVPALSEDLIELHKTSVEAEKHINFLSFTHSDLISYNILNGLTRTLSATEGSSFGTTVTFCEALPDSAVKELRRGINRKIDEYFNTEHHSGRLRS